MDAFEELERLARNTANIDEAITISTSDIERWVQLFGYTAGEALSKLEQQRNDFIRIQVSDAHWDIVRIKVEAEGHDRTSYEHELSFPGRRKSIVMLSSLSGKVARAEYLLRLDEPLSSTEIVARAAQLTRSLEYIEGEGDKGKTGFCVITGLEKQSLMVWLSTHASGFVPTLARLTRKAPKRFSSSTLYPTLGVESTLPQHRPCSLQSFMEVFPAQHELPVWYFFYGTLTHVDILSKQTGLAEDKIELYPAHINGGRLEIWGGKYKALVDGGKHDVVEGFAFLVVSKEQEDGLRIYETDKYEVVRCEISVHKADSIEQYRGCTFRFCGDIDV